MVGRRGRFERSNVCSIVENTVEAELFVGCKDFIDNRTERSVKRKDSSKDDDALRVDDDVGVEVGAIRVELKNDAGATSGIGMADGVNNRNLEGTKGIGTDVDGLGPILSSAKSDHTDKTSFKLVRDRHAPNSLHKPCGPSKPFEDSDPTGGEAEVEVRGKVPNMVGNPYA